MLDSLFPAVYRRLKAEPFYKLLLKVVTAGLLAVNTVAVKSAGSNSPLHPEGILFLDSLCRFSKPLLIPCFFVNILNHKGKEGRLRGF